MNLLLHLYPGDAAVEFAGRILVEISLVICLGGLLDCVALRRRPAARHALWLGVLIAVAVAPLTLAAIDSAGWMWSVRRPVPLNETAATAIFSKTPSIVEVDQEVSRPSGNTSLEFNDSPEFADGMGTDGFSNEPARIVAVWPSRSVVDLWRLLASVGTFIWLSGVTFLLARLARGDRHVRRLLSDMQPLEPRRIDNSREIAARTLGVKSLPPIVMSAAVAGPVVAGLVRPTVVLPADLVTRAGTSQLADVLVHECAHVVRWDPWIGFVQRLVQMAFWPHPLIYIMNRSLSRVREEVCDNFVLRRGDAVSYAQTLLELTERYNDRPAPVATLAIFSPRWRLEDRVAGLLDPRRQHGTQVSRAIFLVLVALLVVCGSTLVAGRFDESKPDERAATLDAAASAAERPELPPSKLASTVRESRAWHILSQTDADGLLLGMPQRLGRASEPARRSEPSWTGVDDGGSVELDIEVEGDANGELVVGFFESPRWWLAEPVQVRQFPGPGRYTIDRLPPGKFQVGAMIGELPRPGALGVHRTWPAPVTVAAGKTTQVELRVPYKYKDHVFGHGQVLEGFAGMWKKMDPAKTITIRTADEQDKPVPFCRITLVERQPDDPAKVHLYHDAGTDDRGNAHFELNGLFSLNYQRFEFVPETMTFRYQFIRESKGYDSRRGPLYVEWKWGDFPVGSGKVRGRVHDQHGKPLTEYFLTLTRNVGDQRSNDDAASYALRLPIIDSDGRFEVTGLVAGTYTMMVRHFDVVTHVSSFDGPKVTIPEERDAEVDFDLEVEARELRYARAVFDDGQPVRSGAWIAWFTRDPTSAWGGTNFAQNIEPDGSFRVPLSREEWRLLNENSGGMIEVSSQNENRRVTEVKMPFEKLSRDPKQPTKVILPRPGAASQRVKATDGTFDPDKRLGASTAATAEVADSGGNNDSGGEVSGSELKAALEAYEKGVRKILSYDITYRAQETNLLVEQPNAEWEAARKEKQVKGREPAKPLPPVRYTAADPSKEGRASHSRQYFRNGQFRIECLRGTSGEFDVGQRMIVWNGESQTSFNGREGTAFLVSTAANNAMMGEEVPHYELFYRMAFGDYLYSQIVQDRESTCTEKGGLLEIEARPAPTRPVNLNSFGWRLLLDPRANHLPKRITVTLNRGEQTVNMTQIDNTLEEVKPGVWFPVEAVVSFFVSMPDSPQFKEKTSFWRYTLDREVSRFNVSVDGDLFNLRFPKGTVVTDRRIVVDQRFPALPGLLMKNDFSGSGPVVAGDVAGSVTKWRKWV